MLKRKTFVTLLAVGLLTAPLAANAALIGAWTGEWSNGPYAADFDLTFDSETPAGAFTGYFDWFCTAGLTCSGREFFAGTLAGSALTFATTGIAPGAQNLAFASYSGTLSDPWTIIGTDSGNGRWSARAVPEPGTIALLGLGLVIVGLLRRRRSSTSHS